MAEQRLGAGERCEACERILFANEHNPESMMEAYDAGAHVCKSEPRATPQAPVCGTCNGDRHVLSESLLSTEPCPACSLAPSTPPPAMTPREALVVLKSVVEITEFVDEDDDLRAYDALAVLSAVVEGWGETRVRLAAMHADLVEMERDRDQWRHWRAEDTASLRGEISALKEERDALRSECDEAKIAASEAVCRDCHHPETKHRKDGAQRLSCTARGCDCTDYVPGAVSREAYNEATGDNDRLRRERRDLRRELAEAERNWRNMREECIALRAQRDELVKACERLVLRFNPDKQAIYGFARQDIDAARTAIANARGVR
jgi:hypothetical protein